MKNPVDTVKGRIVDYDSHTGELVIRAYYPDWPIIKIIPFDNDVSRGFRKQIRRGNQCDCFAVYLFLHIMKNNLKNLS